MKNKIIGKSFLIWMGLIPLAFINGGFRELFLIPRLGHIGLPISAIILCLMIFLLSYIFIPKLGNSDKKTFLKIGIYWALATVVFEVLLGFVIGKSLNEIITPYNILTGNLWIVVVLFTGITPLTVAKIRKLLK